MTRDPQLQVTERGVFDPVGPSRCTLRTTCMMPDGIRDVVLLGLLGKCLEGSQCQGTLSSAVPCHVIVPEAAASPHGRGLSWRVLSGCHLTRGDARCSLCSPAGSIRDTVAFEGAAQGVKPSLR